MQQTIIKQKHLSGYDLTNNLIRGGLSSLNLSANTKLVLLYLATCYNEKKGVVFPKIKTIAEAVGISEISVKRAIKELLKENCILKTKRFKNSNEYIITNKILETKQTDTKPNQKDTSKGIKLILPIEHEIKQEEVKKQQLKEEIKKVVAFSSNFNKKPGPINMAEIPDIIRENTKIKNVIGYWRSLDDTAKAEYIEKDKEVKELKARRELREREREKKTYENYLKFEALKNAKPFSETCTKEQALNYIKTTYGGNNVMKSLAQRSRTVKQLLNRFNLELSQVL